jgi:quinoprotein glucose dehydrogenase
VLRASTGELVWTFQTVHHDLWDYDVPMQPILFTLEREGRAVPAVAVGTKSGHIFVLNRETGVPLFPVEEHPVPQTTVPGEETSPTQPFPTALPVFGLRQLTPEDAWGLTPADIRTAPRGDCLCALGGSFHADRVEADRQCSERPWRVRLRRAEL